MAYNITGGFPPQQLSFTRKNKAWRKRCIDFGDDYSLLHHHLTRKSVLAMKVNYDLRSAKRKRARFSDSFIVRGKRGIRTLMV